MEIQKAKEILKTLSTLVNVRSKHGRLTWGEKYDLVMIAPNGLVLQEGKSIFVASEEDSDFHLIICEAPEVPLEGVPPAWLICIEREAISHNLCIPNEDRDLDDEEILCCEGEKALIKLEALLKCVCIRDKESGELVEYPV